MGWMMTWCGILLAHAIEDARMRICAAFVVCVFAMVTRHTSYDAVVGGIAIMYTAAQTREVLSMEFVFVLLFGAYAILYCVRRGRNMI